MYIKVIVKSGQKASTFTVALGSVHYLCGRKNVMYEFGQIRDLPWAFDITLIALLQSDIVDTSPLNLKLKWNSHINGCSLSQFSDSWLVNIIH